MAIHFVVFCIFGEFLLVLWREISKDLIYSL